LKSLISTFSENWHPGSYREVGGNWLRWRRFRLARSRRNPRHDRSYATMGIGAIAVRRKRVV
jgi:hypothetical protein